MTMQFKKVSDVGTANPIAARLTFQWLQILPLYVHSKPQGDNFFGILHDNVQPRLVECERISLSLKADIEQIQAKVDRQGLSVQAGGRAVECPSVMRLRERVEDYLSDAKLALRDFSRVFSEFFGNEVPKGNYAKIAEWAHARFGQTDELPLLLKEDHDLWLKRLSTMRDAVEHPDGDAGPLTIQDFRLDLSQPTKILVIEPMWNLRGEDPSPIVRDLATFNHNLLTFCEEIMMLCLARVYPEAPIMLVEIPEAERNPAAPIRFVAQIDRTKIKPSA